MRKLNLRATLKVDTDVMRRIGRLDHPLPLFVSIRRSCSTVDAKQILHFEDKPPSGIVCARPLQKSIVQAHETMLD